MSEGEQRQRAPLPWSLAWFAVLVVPALPAVVRVVTGLSFAISAAIVGVLLIPVLWVLRPRLRRPSTHERTAAIVGIVLGLVAAYAMYTPWFRGAVCISGTPDAGNHANFLVEFLDHSAHQYADFVLLYGIVAWFRMLPHFGVFIGFTVVFYATILGFIAFYTELAVRWSEEGRGTRGRLVALIGAPILVAAAAHGVILVQLHYYHAEGFYPQIYVLLLFFGAWLVDARLDDGVAKVVALLASAALIRYTYGLNLPDLCLALAIVVCTSRASFRTRWSALATILGAVIFLFVAWRAVIAIRGYYLKWGPFIPYDVKTLAASEAVLALCLLPALFDRESRRRFRLPFVFAFINVGFFVVAKRPKEHLDYYYLKTSFQPFLLVLVAAGVAMLRGVARAVDDGRIVRGLAYVGVFAIGLGASSYATRMWRDSYEARLYGHPPWNRMWPLFDPNAQLGIDRVLASHQAAFGGYLTSFYPTQNFMNAAMGFWQNGIDFYYAKTHPDESAGHCVFWEGGPNNTHLETMYPADRERQPLDSSLDKTCMTYRPTWDPSIERTMCWNCF